MFQEKNVSGKCCSNVFTTLSQCWQRFYNVFTTFWQLFMERNVVTTFFRVDKSTLWQRFTMFLAMLLKCCENVFWFIGYICRSNPCYNRRHQGRLHIFQDMLEYEDLNTNIYSDLSSKLHICTFIYCPYIYIYKKHIWL